MSRRYTCDEALKAEVLGALTVGEDIEEAYIESRDHNGRRWRYHGITDYQKVIVNPTISVLDTLIHELTHRFRQKWGEKRVEREARRILRTMDDKTIRYWHRRYQQVAVKRRRPVKGDA